MKPLRMRKLCLALLVLVMSSATLCASNGNDDNFEFTHNRFAFAGSLTSSDTYHLEVSYHYMLNRTIGFGGAIGMWQVYYEDGWAAGKDWEIESEDNKPFNFFLRPSVVIKSPAIKNRQFDVGLFAEPGVVLNIPYASVNICQTTAWPNYELKHISTSKGQWFGMEVRLGVYVNVGRCGFCAGYMMSNYDVYSQYRHLRYKGISFSEFYPRKPSLKGASIIMSYYF